MLCHIEWKYRKSVLLGSPLSTVEATQPTTSAVLRSESFNSLQVLMLHSSSKRRCSPFSRSGVVQLLRSIVTSFGVVVAGNSILPKNPMALFIQLFKFILQLTVENIDR